MDEWDSLENCCGLRFTVSSNLTLSVPNRATFYQGPPCFFVLSPAILKTIVYIAQQNIDEQDTQDKKLEKNILLILPIHVHSPIKHG